MSITLEHGNASDWSGHADLVFTHPYAPLPACLIGTPAIINLHGDKVERAERWVGAELTEIGRWGDGLMNRVYVANMPAAESVLDRLAVMKAVPAGPGLGGWFPLALPRLLLDVYAPRVRGYPELTVWDGFMGRGTVGKACDERGLSYVGIDRDLSRVTLARIYLGVRRSA